MHSRFRYKPLKSSRSQKPRKCRLHTESLEPRLLLAVTPVTPDALLELDGVGQLRTAIDSQGNAVVVGQFEGTVDFDPGPGVHVLSSSNSSDLFLAKYSPSMALIEAVDLGDIDLYGSYGSPSLAVDANNDVYITGSYEGSGCLSLTTVSPTCNGPGEFLVQNERVSAYAMFVAKVDSSLQDYTWVNYATLSKGTTPGGKVTGKDIEVDAGGNAVYVSGFLRGKGQIGDQNIQVGETGFVCKLNGNSGEFEWTKTGIPRPDTIKGAIALDDSDPNALYVTQTSYLAKLDPLGNVLWERGDIESFGDIVAADGSVYVGHSDNTLVRKFDGANGDLVWTSGTSGPGGG